MLERFKMITEVNGYVIRAIQVTEIYYLMETVLENKILSVYGTQLIENMN